MVGKIALGLFATTILLIVVLILNHNNRLRKEALQYPPPGKLVKVENKKLHIFATGQGNNTLVFMSGHGTSNPTIDFMPLWKRMSDENRVIVVEKFGYGWSETSNSPRDIDTMLEQTRQALILAGETGPYILVPHSMSGLEAIYWAQKYPAEVSAIIGLDPSTPDSVQQMPQPNKIQLIFMYVISRLGLSRFMPDSEIEEIFPLMKSNCLSTEDKAAFMATFFRSSFTRNMLSEVRKLYDNAKSVEKQGIPTHIPMYFFISNDDQLQQSSMNWQELLANYVKQLDIGKYKQLDTGHYVHHEKSAVIAGEMRRFIELINRSLRA